jgi:hypothetical protein
MRVMHMALSWRKEAKACQCLCNRGYVPQARQQSQQVAGSRVATYC